MREAPERHKAMADFVRDLKVARQLSSTDATEV
jgi:hypothetical protein